MQTIIKRIEPRLPSSLYSRISNRAKTNRHSFNATFNHLMKKAVNALFYREFERMADEQNLKIMPYVGNGRVIFGSQVNNFPIDFTQDLCSIEKAVNEWIGEFNQSARLNALYGDKKAVINGNVLEIVDGQDKGCDWLVIEDIKR